MSVASREQPGDLHGAWTDRLALGRLWTIGWTAFQFGLIILVIRAFHIESAAFLRLIVLAWAGFIVHSLLPRRWQLPFFGCLSFAGIWLVLGWANGLWLVGTGLCLIGLAHLPVAFAARVAAIVVTGGALWAARASWIDSPVPFPGVVWPILGSMFMFRMIVYLYDLRDGEAPFGFWRAVAYFFMLPNVCFPLFPVVDYATLCRTYQSEEETHALQTGVVWMLRGCVHLLAYRLIYQQWIVAPSEVTTGGQVVQLSAATFLLYLRVSGSFHLIVGMLRMFGLHLPATNQNYLLASSFTDHWRRINIYWKDFILKTFFNPIYFPLRKKWGDRPAIVTAAVCSFVATWFLHSCQWFWIRGEFIVRWQDMVFWSALGSIVCVNMLWELGHRPRRSLRKKKRTLRQDLGLVLRVAGTMAGILLFWTIWSASSISELGILLGALLHFTPLELVATVAALLLLGVVAAALLRTPLEQPDLVRSPDPVRASRARWLQATAVCSTAAVLLLVAYQPTVLAFAPALAGAADQLREKRLNAADTRRMERGYYEDIADVSRFDDELASVYTRQPADWRGVEPTTQPTGGFPAYELIPSNRVRYKGVLQGANAFGMRDRAYTQEKPPGVLRIAMIGASHTKGSGVDDDVTYENQLEDRLALETGGHVEVLNFSVGGYGPLSRLATLRGKALSFSPDIVIIVGVDEFEWVLTEISNALDSDFELPFPGLLRMVEEAGVAGDLPPVIVEHRLRPRARELAAWVYAEYARVGREAGIRVFSAILPRPEDVPDEAELIAEQQEMARRAGLTVLDMSDAYEGVEDHSTLWVAPWDRHPNVEGHRRLADRLYRSLMPHLTIDREASAAGQPSRRERQP